MIDIPLQETSLEIWEKKYQLKDQLGNPVDKNIDDMYSRVAKALADVEPRDKEYWEEQFYRIQKEGATPAGRITSNAGAQEYKPATSLINCVISSIVPDHMEGIMQAVKESAMTLKAGCGIGYEFSTLRPKGSFVSGAGATTSGPLSFMDVFDKMCFTVSSAGGRRGAEMGTFAVWHPDVEDFIKAKREDGRLRQFNLSLLIDEDFVNKVKADEDWDLVFPLTQQELDFGFAEKVMWKDLFWEKDYCRQQGYTVEDGKILCKVYKTVKATYLWDLMMKSTFDYAEPGFILIDRVNEYNNNWWCEKIRTTNPCGEQPISPYGACLLGSVNLAKFVDDPFTEEATFNWEQYKNVVRVFTRMLDNVVELNGLPLEQQRKEIESKRRHGMGFLGLGSALSLLGLEYGSEEAVGFTEEVSKVMAMEGYEAGIALAKEKGPAPILEDMENRKKWADSKFLQQLWEECPELKVGALKYGCRFTHATSIAPTGTISLSLNNNVSNGIEPTFSHKYIRNVIKEGKKTKQAVPVYSYEMLLYKEMFGTDEVPETFSTSDTVTWKQHVDMQAAAQKWVDSSISKTINVPTDTKFEEFKDIYLYAADQGLKGVTTFRFNPDTLQGVLVREEDSANTKYEFTLEDGSVVVASGPDTIFYDGEEHNAANLYDGMKEGHYGKF